MMAVKPLILCGPSGVGKSTFVKRLLEDFPSHFGFCVSHTTRSRRSNETDGIDYYFVSVESMEKDIAEGKFVEFAVFDGDLYGTSKEAIREVHNTGKICILDIDLQGVQQIRDVEDLDPWYVFIQPPSFSSLEKRLRLRNTESEERLKRRLDIAKKEIESRSLIPYFDLDLVNEDLEEAYKQLKDFVQSKVLL